MSHGTAESVEERGGVVEVDIFSALFLEADLGDHLVKSGTGDEDAGSLKPLTALLGVECKWKN